MKFLDPYYLLLLVLPLILTVWKIRAGGGFVRTFFTNFQSMRSSVSSAYFFPQFLDVIAIVLAIVALARPVSLQKTIVPPVEGKDIMVVLDVSGSMEALDFQPKNRIEAAKLVIKDFIKGRTSDRLGLVFFAHDSFLQVPLTTDYDVYHELLSRLKTGVIDDGTAIGNGVGLALSRLESSKAKSRIVILLTDGDNNAGNLSPETAAEIAEKEGIKIYSILIGTDKPVKFPAGKDFFGRQSFQTIKMKTNPDLLKMMAETSNGKFYQSISTKDLQKAFKDIDSLEKSPVPSRKLKIYNEYAVIFIGLSILLIVLARLLALLFKVFPEVER